MERKAKKVVFDPKRTLIHGSNGTGKSCLIKSIYKTFGATPAKEHPTWKNINPVSLVKFKVDNVKYSILKDGKYYAIFDAKDNLLDVFDGVTKELAPFLANLFDFNIKLPNAKGDLITPPPAFLFLPYYIDQDASWLNSWSSFSSLQQIKSYKEPIASYHTGLKPNEYYVIKSEIDKYETKIGESESERKILRNLLNRVNEKIGLVEFNINIDDFKEEIAELLIRCEELKNKQEELKSNLVNLYNSKIIIDSQLTITKKALSETRKDYEYATEILVENEVDCPTCGAHYENSFVDRFEIAKDEDRCKELIMELLKEQDEINKKIDKENGLFTKNNEEIANIEIVLEKRKGEVKLRDVIENAGRSEVKSVFEENLRNIVQTIKDDSYEKDQLDKRLKGLTNAERKKEILGVYHSLMKKNLHTLDVKTIKEENYKTIAAKIPETGSALPRALTAYYFSILEVIRKYTTSAFCPIIIDSPNQQAQDIKHLDVILKFIKENQPNDSQMILGLEELYGIDFKCKIIELKDKGSLLQEDEFDEVNSELDNYQTKVWNFGKGNRMFS